MKLQTPCFCRSSLGSLVASWNTGQIKCTYNTPYYITYLTYHTNFICTEKRRFTASDFDPGASSGRWQWRGRADAACVKHADRVSATLHIKHCIVNMYLLIKHWILGTLCNVSLLCIALYVQSVLSSVPPCRPYTPSQVFDTIADVERYPDFLPWCVYPPPSIPFFLLAPSVPYLDCSLFSSVSLNTFHPSRNPST